VQGMKFKHGVSLHFICEGIVIVDHKKQSTNALGIHVISSLLLKFGWSLILLPLLGQLNKILNLFRIQWKHTHDFYQAHVLQNVS
jgi:hypothetical protein